MKVVVIGGGTGTTAVLNGLKKFSDITLSVIVTMTDDGGSNAIVRDEFGLLPLSDLRKSIIALSSRNDDEILRKLFLYRFDKGDGLAGHTLGNLIMVALSDITGSEKEAVKKSSELFDVFGTIIPVTLEHTRLVADYADHKTVVGEHNIDESAKKSKLLELSFTKPVHANEDAIEAIRKAEVIVIGPGDIYTSIIPNLLPLGIKEAIQQSKARVVYITNLMTKVGETRGLTQLEIIKEIEKYSGRTPDFVFVNNGKIPQSAMEKYRAKGDSVIPFDKKETEEAMPNTKIVLADLISRSIVKKDKGDSLDRSLIRHSPDKVGKELYAILRKNAFNALSFLITNNPS